jgi:hypothetical protein
MKNSVGYRWFNLFQKEHVLRVWDFVDLDFSLGVTFIISYLFKIV